MPDKNFSFTGFGSAAVHAGHEKDPRYAHLVPIYASSTYVFDSAEQGNISYVLLSAMVRADIYKFGFKLLTSTLYFQLGCGYGLKV